MKVDIINYPVLTNQHRLKSVPENSGVSLRGELCKNNYENVNRGYYSGSSVSFGSAAKLSSRMLDSLLDACNKHTTIVQNLVALVLALGPRPLAIMSLPGKKDKEDKIYASGHSMASGLIGFGFASIIMYPLGIAADKVKKNDVDSVLKKIDKSNDVKLVTRRLAKLAKEANIPEEELTAEKILKGTKHLEPDFLKQFGAFQEKDGKLTRLTAINSEFDFGKFYKEYNIVNLTREKLKEGTKYIGKNFFDNFIKYDKKGKFLEFNKSADFDKVYKCLNMAPDVFVFGILKAMLTVALIPPILKYVFGLEKGKSKQPPAQPAQVQNVNKEGGNK
ncbi:hypothetical protein J6I39_05355 [bacterium]|nr:hypothetical protein [bacterium]